ncbi:MAG: hypothetical protein ACOYU0_03670 [Nitrospirota bacterium]
MGLTSDKPKKKGMIVSQIFGSHLKIPTNQVYSKETIIIIIKETNEYGKNLNQGSVRFGSFIYPKILETKIPKATPWIILPQNRDRTSRK